MEDLAQLLLDQGQPLPRPDSSASKEGADLIEIVPLPVHVGAGNPSPRHS
jgi:hypothetical protein